MVSESPGRNESERKGGLETYTSRRPSLLLLGEGSMLHRRLAEAVVHSGGVLAAARGQGHAKQLEKPSSPRTEMYGGR